MTTDKKSIVFMVLHACLFFMVFCLPDFLESSLDTRSGPKINIDKLEKEIHNLVNKERHIKGLSELRWNKTLNAIARMHSKDMIEKNYFSHQSPEGHDFTYRYKKHGFACEIHIGNITHNGAENISQDNLFDSVVYKDGAAFYNWNTKKEIVESIVRRWMSSRGHRENILSPYWKSEGIGAAISEDGKVYVTENFC